MKQQKVIEKKQDNIEQKSKGFGISSTITGVYVFDQNL